jgi:hypothetical protein
VVLSTTLPRLSNQGSLGCNSAVPYWVWPYGGPMHTNQLILPYLYRAVIRLHPINAVVMAFKSRLYRTSSFHIFIFFLSFFLVNTTSPPLYSPLLPSPFSSPHHGFFQQREYLAPRGARTASLSSSARFIRIPSNCIWEQGRGKIYTPYESQT